MAWTIRQAGVASVVCAVDHPSDRASDRGLKKRARRTVSGDVPPAGRATMDVTPDGRIVYPTGDGRLVLVDPHDSAEEHAAADAGSLSLRTAFPGPAFLTPVGVRASAPAVSPDGQFVAYVSETQETCVVAVVAVDESTAPVICSQSDFAFDPYWSPDGALLTWHEWDFPAMPWDDSRIVVYRWPDGPATVVAGVVAGGAAATGATPEAVGQPRFSPDGRRLAYVSDRDGWMNIYVCTLDGSDARIASAEPHEAGPREHAEPTWGPGQRSYAWSPDSRFLAWCANSDGAGALVLGSAEGSSEDHLAGREIAPRWHRGIRWTDEGGLLAVRSAPDESPRVVRYDFPADVSSDAPSDVPSELPSDAPGDSAESTRITIVEAPAMEGAVPEPEPVTWEGEEKGATSHGTALHGLLWRCVRDSASVPSRSRPLLVHLHGGPTDQAVADWWPRAAYFLGRGWNILTPNGRGSTGHGRSYAQALAGQWGVVDVADVVAALRAVGTRGWGDPHRIALSGGSAGGFTALLVSAAVPDLVRATVVRYPVTDLEALAAATHRFEAHYTDSLVGTLPEAAEIYRDRSPMIRTGSIAVPLLVLQGADDPAVPRSQTDAFVRAARESGVDVDYRVYDGEGHGFSDPATVVDELGRTETFLARHVLSDPT